MTHESDLSSAPNRPFRSPHPRGARRRWAPPRPALVIAAAFSVLALLGSGAGLMLGEVASVGFEHDHAHDGHHASDPDDDGAAPVPAPPHAQQNR